MDREHIITVNKNCFITLFTEWEQLDFRKKWNWITITPIHIFFEKDSMTYGYLFQITLMGFSVSLRYNTDEALRQFAKWEKESKEIMEGKRDYFKLVKAKRPKKNAKEKAKKTKTKTKTKVN